MVQLPSVLELNLEIGLSCHTQLAAQYPLHHVFPRLQHLQIKYYNDECDACGYFDEPSFDSDGYPTDLNRSLSSEPEELPPISNALECVLGLVAQVLPHLTHLRGGHVKISRKSEDGTDCWPLDQLM